jgi:uncharacterized protein YecE (DUF72 family)
MRKRAADKIFIGTSGWHYAQWRGGFYPDQMLGEKFLDFYQNYFNTVEINNTFYRLPDRKILLDWKNSVPESFLFSPKASRYITHTRKLIDVSIPLKRFILRMEDLEGNLGPILFQLPPDWKINLSRLEHFINILSYFKKNFFVFEFSNAGWLTSELKNILEKNGVAFAITQTGQISSPLWVTSQIAYIRLSKPDFFFNDSWHGSILPIWAERIVGWARSGKTVFVYMAAEAGQPAADALKLSRLVKTGLETKKEKERKPAGKTAEKNDLWA